MGENAFKPTVIALYNTLPYKLKSSFSGASLPGHAAIVALDAGGLPEMPLSSLPLVVANDCFDEVSPDPLLTISNFVHL